MIWYINILCRQKLIGNKLVRFHQFSYKVFLYKYNEILSFSHASFNGASHLCTTRAITIVSSWRFKLLVESSSGLMWLCSGVRESTLLCAVCVVHILLLHFLRHVEVVCTSSEICCHLVVTTLNVSLHFTVTIITRKLVRINHGKHLREALADTSNSFLRISEW